MNNNSRSKGREYEINVLELLSAILKKWWLVLLAMSLGCALMFFYTRYFVTPLYESSVSFYVNNGQRTEDKISNSDITAAQSLVDTYIVILKYGTTLDDVIKDADLDCTSSQLAGKINCEAINDTEVFQVTVTDPSPAIAEKTAKSIEKILPARVADVIEGSTVRVVRSPAFPEHPSSPNIHRNVILGAFAGVLLGCLYAVVEFLMDDRIRNASQFLKERYPFPVLAAIPDLTQNSSGYYYKSSGKRS